MNLQLRIELLNRLGEYMLSDATEWKNTRVQASNENSWFIPEFIELSVRNIALTFLQEASLRKWVGGHANKIATIVPKNVGIVMAGNIPLVGFHDLLSVFISGHRASIKLSSKDKVLTEHLAGKLTEWVGDDEIIRFSEMLKNCDAYIATGSNNSSRYFEYYIGKYHHIIRRNKTSVAILSGDENHEELEKLADDVYQYFGLGCRNVTKIWVPENYDFLPLLEAFRKYTYLIDHNKYKNNYDYNLTLLILNKRYYMTNGSILLVEEPALFSPVSQLNYEYYKGADAVRSALRDCTDLQSVVGQGFVPFGEAQSPALDDYADGVNTLEFLLNIWQ